MQKKIEGRRWRTRIHSLFEKTRLLIADDHVIARDAKVSMLSQHPRMVICGLASSYEGFFEKSILLKPDVILIDGILALRRGLEIIRMIMDSLPETRCILLGGDNSPCNIERARGYGIQGYLLKNASQLELYKAMEDVLNGGAVYPSLIDLPSKRVSELSQRELQVLKLLAEGHKSREIGEILFISVRTVEKHRLSLSLKVNIHNPYDLVAAARREEA